MRKRPAIAVTMAAALALVVLGAVSALALINPNFTPNDLVEQSEQILVVRLSKPDAKNQIRMEVVRALKGRKPDGALILDLNAASQKEWAKHVGELAAARGDAPVPLFIGKYQERGEGGEGGEAGGGEEGGPVEAALLQLDRDWVEMDQGKGDVWNMNRVEARKQGTWDGGSDMLIKAVEHILKYPDERVPVEVGCSWSGVRKPGRVEGRARTALALDLDGKGAFVLHVGASGGDKLFGWNAARKDFADLTAARGLGAKSLLAAWADFDGDGRLDLASFDGTALAIHVQGADGTFGAKPAEAGVKVESGWLSLAALDVGAGRRAGLLIGTDRGPVVARPADGGWKAEALAVPAEALGALGKASACLVADLDGDGWAEVFQPFEKGGLIWKGKGPGAFEAPVRNEMGTGKDLASCTTGDYDMDGLLDVYMVGPECVRFWNNRGGLRFAEAFGHSGEMVYTAQPGGVAAQTMDINNDGLQDLFIAFGVGVPQPSEDGKAPPEYPKDRYPHIYFNRGFRSFGKALSIVWENQDFMAEAGEGQQCATAADFDGDGAQDVAMVLREGGVAVFMRAVFDAEDTRPLSAQALLRAASGTAGPVTVTGWSERRCLGAWSVTPGSTGGFFGLSAPGEVKLKWRLPGGGELGAAVELENGPKPVFLEAAGKGGTPQ